MPPSIKEENKVIKFLINRYRKYFRYFKITATAFSVPSSIFSAYILIQPKISVEPKQYIHESKYITNGPTYYFIIKNEGHTPIYDIYAGCGHDSEFIKNGLVLNGTDNSRLNPGNSEYISCEIPEDDHNLRFGVQYNWLFGLISQRIDLSFQVIHSKDPNNAYVFPFSMN